MLKMHCKDQRFIGQREFEMLKRMDIIQQKALNNYISSSSSASSSSSSYLRSIYTTYGCVNFLGPCLVLGSALACVQQNTGHFSEDNTAQY